MSESGASQRGPLTVVVWEDTTNMATWLDEQEVVEFATDGGWRCRNVGWVTYEDEDCVVVSARLAEDRNGHVGLSERIPKRAIIERLALGPTPDRKVVGGHPAGPTRAADLRPPPSSVTTPNAPSEEPR